MDTPIKPTDFTFTDETQRKHSYIHYCRGCYMVSDFIPATDKGYHLNCPAGKCSIGWCGTTREEWHSYTDEQKEAYRQKLIDDSERLRARVIASIEANKPHCPTCNSVNIATISSLNRAASILTWGIFSRKINKQFRCQNCGYMW